jgi:hypothetical protein
MLCTTGLALLYGFNPIQFSGIEIISPMGCILLYQLNLEIDAISTQNNLFTGGKYV